MAALARPSVSVIQEFETASPTILVPTLRPHVLGAAFEVIEVLNSDQTLNEDAQDEAYDQFPQTIAQSSFPSPRNNIDEVDVLEESIRAFLTFGGSLYELDNGDDTYGDSGSAFLAFANWAYRPGILSKDDSTAFNFGAGMYLVLSIDNPLESDTTPDVTVSLSGVMTVTQIIAAINTAVGSTVASEYVHPISGDSHVLIASTNYGAGASVTIRSGAAAAAIMYTNLSGSAVTYRVTGAGFRGQDDGDSDTTTPWIEYHRGAYTEDAVAAAWAADGPIQLPESYADPGDEIQTFAAARTFTGASPDVPLQAANTTRPGDTFWADGTQVESAEVIAVQTSRFKLGLLNTTNSVFDDDGNPVTRSYDTVEVGNLFDSSPLAPRNAWFGAQGLIEGSITPAPVAAVLTGTEEGLPAQYGYVRSRAVDFTAPIDLTGWRLYFRTTIDDVQGAEQSVILAGAAANMAAIAAQLGSVTGMVASSHDTGAAYVAASLELQLTNLAGCPGVGMTLDLRPIGGSLLTFTEGVDWNHDAGSIINSVGALSTYINGLDKIAAVDDGVDTVTMTVEGSVEGNFCLFTIDDATGGWTVDPGGAATPSPTANEAFLAGAGGEYLILQTSSTGDDQAVEVLSTGSYNGVELVRCDGSINAGVFGSGIGRDVEFSERAAIDNIHTAFPAFAPGDILHITGDDRNGDFNYQYALAAADYAAGTWVELAKELNAGGNAATGPNANENYGVPVVTFVGDDTALASGLYIYSLQGGATVTVTAGADMDANFNLAAATDNGDDHLTGNPFGWLLDLNPHIWEVTFASESLEDAIDLINDEMDGNLVASAGGTNNRQLVLTSLLAGQASWMTASQDVSYTDTITAFGLLTPDHVAQGSGRPNPDFYLDLSGSVVIGAQILRNLVTGIPYDNEYVGNSYIYLGYKGLRLDVTPSAASGNPGLLVIEDTTQLASLLSPLTTDNPLGLGLFFAKLNAPGVSVTGLGVDEVTGAHPEGTLSAFTAGAEFLESEEVYAIAPLTHQPTVHQMMQVHVDYMSDPDQRGERILFFNPEVPTEENPTVVSSGTDGNTTGTSNQFICDENPAAALIAQGINPALPIPVSDGLYLEVTVAGELEKYNISAVNGALLTINTTFATGENDDGFYTTTSLTATLISVSWSLEVRGAELTVAGQPDLDGIADTIATIASTYADRRLYMVFPDTFEAELDAGTTSLEGYYACAAIAGMVGQQLPQQGFTNFPIAGFTGVNGSNDTFKDSLLDEIAGGGTYIIIQEADGAALTCRHQLSTEVTSIETRELSITKDVDFCAKVLRTSLRNYLGIFNITPQFIDTLTTVVEGLLEFLKSTGALLGANLNEISQSATNPDTILVDISLDVPYPCNYIRVVLTI